VDLGRQVLANLAIPLHEKIAEAYKRGDRDAFQSESAQMLDLIRDMDRLVASRPEFLLGKWISDARSWGTNENEKDLYERNARLLLTQWGPQNARDLPDYSWREWSGLLNNFYLPRWKLFFDFLDRKIKAREKYDESTLHEVDDRPTYDSNALYQSIFTFEKQWIASHETYSSEPHGDSIAIAQELLEKYTPLCKQLCPIKN
jgi:alpha-N-acetylglucosaminidase